MPAAGIRSLQPNEINTVISACVGLGNGVLLRHNTQETLRGDAGSNRTLQSHVDSAFGSSSHSLSSANMHVSKLKPRAISVSN